MPRVEYCYLGEGSDFLCIANAVGIMKDQRVMGQLILARGSPGWL